MKNKSLLLKIIISIILISFILVICVNMDSDKIQKLPINQQETVRIGAIPGLPPYCFLKDKNNLIGYNIDVMYSIALEQGIPIDIVVLDKDKALEELKEGKIDAVLGLQYSPDLSQSLKFSKPFIINKFSIFIKHSNNKIRGIEDLRHKKVSVYKDDPALERLKNIEGIRLFTTETPEDAMLLLAYGMTDASVINRLTGMYYLMDSKYNNKIKIIGEQVDTLPSSIATLKENTELIETFNQGLETLEKRGTLEIIRRNWLGESIPKSLKVLKQVLILIVTIGTIITFVAIIFYRVNKILKKEIEIRTKKIEEEAGFKAQIIESLFDGLITIDTEGRILGLNSNVEDIIGEYEEELINQNIKESSLAKLFNLNHIEYVIRNKTKLIQLEKSYVYNGEEKIVHYNITPIKNSDDEIKEITLTFRDVTEEKKIMNKLAMKDKMETVGRLTASIAHEIRNPLTSIDMYIKLLPEKIDNEDFRNSLIRDIPKEISRLDNIIKNLLDYAKPLPPRKQLFSAKKEMDSILGLVANHVNKKDINLIVNLKKDMMIYFDIQQFKQIMLNLIINSVDALNEVHEPTLEISGYEEGRLVIFEIKDNGQGIPNNIRNNIFEPFFTTKEEGYGLGLSIVDQLAKENDAEIFLDYNYKEGAKFVLVIEGYIEDQCLLERTDSTDEEVIYN
ncbi:transporter substrate-binding domain-containing protein [Tissierella sp. MSJ-40]|uniref:Transporter substrate-binding domain-containing protein n=1 Tax=Tissierella simiarum TaxID=2841534 RepID=A0ABS6EA20_9FIRM|nr:transporter substrate-binding domain-containing protein [Tissierella simiarum]MBU5439386.1 transporter substrate-binding domain-containing protein [Tissierella simiarum]